MRCDASSPGDYPDTSLSRGRFQDSATTALIPGWLHTVGRLYEILRGRHLDDQDRAFLSGLFVDDEVEVVLEMNRVSRFVTGALVPEDLNPSRREPTREEHRRRRSLFLSARLRVEGGGGRAGAGEAAIQRWTVRSDREQSGAQLPAQSAGDATGIPSLRGPGRQGGCLNNATGRGL